MTGSAERRLRTAGDPSSMPPARLLLLRLVTLLMPLLALALVEGVLQIADYPADIPLFIPAPAPDSAHAYRMVNPRVAERYFPPGFYLPITGYEAFLRTKTVDGYRIFLLGGSTAAGWPYADHVQFARVLEQRLADTFPERDIEIVNTATAAINSYSLLDYMDEVLAEQPDAILIYAGHNEYYGALGAASTATFSRSHTLIRLYLALRDWKIARLLGLGLARVRGAKPGTDLNGEARRTLMGQVIRDTDILLGSPVYERGKRQFRANLEDILKAADAAGVPVLLSELVSNVRDQEPFASQEAPGLPRADSVFRQARQLEAEDDLPAARAAYGQARDLDTIRFRAPGEFNRIIHEVAAGHQTPVVPMQALFEQTSPNGLIGNNLMLEHLHPNVEGHLLMSEGFYQALREHGFIASRWPPERIRPLDYYREHRGATELDRVLAVLAIMDLKNHWPFRADRRGSSAVSRFLPGDYAEELARMVFFNEMAYSTAHREMAAFYQGRGGYDLAAREFQAILDAEPLSLANHRDYAYSLIEAGETEEAETILRRSLKLADSGFAYEWLGRIMAGRGRYDAALPYFERALQYQPEDVDLLIELGRAYYQMGRIEAALETLALLEGSAPGDPRVAGLRSQLGR